MEGVLPEVRRQIIANFYGKNVSKGKMHTFQHFKKMGCKKTAIYRVGDFPACRARWREKIREADVNEVLHLFRSIKSNIEITAREGPYATFH